MEEVLKSQAQLQALCLKRMEAFEAGLDKAAPTTGIASLAAEFNTFKSFMLATLKSLQDQINLLALEADRQEMRTRRKILLVHGVPEVNAEDPVAAVVSTVTKKLAITDFSANDISRCHRMGRIPGSDKPRPILVKLHTLNRRHDLWSTKKALKGSGITLSEFLTKPRHDIFLQARQRFGIHKCWTRDGSVFVLSPAGTRHRIQNIADLENIKDPTTTQVGPASSVPGMTRTRRAAAVTKK